MRSKWNDEITTFVNASMRSRRWRLDDRRDMPFGPSGRSVGKGSLRDRKVPIGVGVQWEFAKGFRLRTSLGLTVYRKIKITDSDNDKVDSKTMDAPGVFGSLKLQYHF